MSFKQYICSRYALYESSNIQIIQFDSRFDSIAVKMKEEDEVSKLMLTITYY
jgi:hypothetical protein